MRFALLDFFPLADIRTDGAKGWIAVMRYGLAGEDVKCKVCCERMSAVDRRQGLCVIASTALWKVAYLLDSEPSGSIDAGQRTMDVQRCGCPERIAMTSEREGRVSFSFSSVSLFLSFWLAFGCPNRSGRR